MTDVEGHIICGGAGACHGEKSILIWDHAALNVAVNLKHQGMIAELIALGVPEAKAHRITHRLGRRMQRFYDDLYEDLADLGLETAVYEPHAQNFDE